MKIKKKLFDQILFIILLVSVINIILNLAISYPFEANYKWGLMIILSMLANKYKERSTWVRFMLILFIIVVLLPLGWYNSGSNNNNVIAYVFLCTAGVSFLFSGWRRTFFVLLLLLMMCTFISVEYLFPNFLVAHDSELVFYDRIIQIPMSIFIVFLMIRQFSNTFHENNLQLNNLNAKLESMAYHDDLTRINNRAYIFEKYKHAIENNQQFITLMIDLDNFKRVNDAYGHLTGDQLLRETGRLLKTHFQDSGHIARYGGDEFIAMLHLDLDTLTKKLDDFMNRFNELEIVCSTGVTISGGYGVFDHHSLDDHLKDVDIALYKAKESGKNKIFYSNIKEKTSAIV